MDSKSSDGWRSILLSLYVGSAFFLMYIKHGADGQYKTELLGWTVSFYEWSIYESLFAGLWGIPLGIFTFFIFLYTYKKAKYQIIFSILNGTLVFVFLIVSIIFNLVPGWMHFEFIADIMFIALISTVGTYLIFGLRKPLTRKSPEALKLQHARRLSVTRQLIWVVIFATLFIGGALFLEPILKTSEQTRATYAFQINIVVNMIVVFYIVVGIFVNALLPYYSYLIKIEEEIEKRSQKGRLVN